MKKTVSPGLSEDYGKADMGIDESLVDEIVRRILAAAAPGKMTRDSDIDLLIVETDPGDRRKKIVKIDATLSGGIAYPANRYGKPRMPFHWPRRSGRRS